LHHSLAMIPLHCRTSISRQREEPRRSSLVRIWTSKRGQNKRWSRRGCKNWRDNWLEEKKQVRVISRN